MTCSCRLVSPTALILEPALGGRDVRHCDVRSQWHLITSLASTAMATTFKTDHDNFGPVVSFAWSPKSENKFL